jgi:hypothetical protein
MSLAHFSSLGYREETRKMKNSFAAYRERPLMQGEIPV